MTGTSGHLGGAIGAHLLERGHEVIGVSRRLNASARTLSRGISLDLSKPGVVDAIAATTSRCDSIVHAAAAFDSDPLAPALTLTNGFGTHQLLALAARWEAERFVYLSSLPVIGRPMQLPVTESHPARPLSAYHASKLYGEQLVVLTPGGVGLRLSAPVGPGMNERRILPAFVRRALEGLPLEVAGDGSRGQDYVDARDIAAAVEAAIERRSSGVLNIASGRCVTNLELARLCVQVLDSRSEVRLSGMPDTEDGVRWEVSIARAERELGYRPAHRLEDSMAALAEARDG